MDSSKCQSELEQSKRKSPPGNPYYDELIGSADTGDSSRKQWFIAAKIGKITFLCRRFIGKQYYENDGPLETLRTAHVTLSVT